MRKVLSLSKSYQLATHTHPSLKPQQQVCEYDQTVFQHFEFGGRDTVYVAEVLKEWTESDDNQSTLPHIKS